jgi:hypothetical protein
VVFAGEAALPAGRLVALPGLKQASNIPATPIKTIARMSIFLMK